MSKRAGGGDPGLTSFVGRRHDLAEGRRLLGGARLVTLVGPGGVGKTRLARALVDEVARAFPDGTYLVELAELHDPDSLATEVAHSLGVEAIGPSHEAAVLSYVRDRRLLLVLDNCEHLGEASARLVHTLLHESPGLRVLATSRQPLGAVGEQLMTVNPLEDAEAGQLFVERARLVVTDFELTPNNAALVSRVCTVLDGMPLAIELAAARLRLLSLRQLVDRLDDRFGVLAIAATAALPRQQTLRASVDWSFDLCSSDEQTLWAWMSVFDGGCDLDAVEAVCAGTGINVFDTVAGLVDKSVLSPREAAGRVRYHMLDTIRAYGRERLAEQGGVDDLAERHRAYFVRFAREAGTCWFGPDQRDTMARTTAEHANLRAAFEACLAAPATYQDALVVCTALWWYWVGHGGVDELLRWLRRSLDVGQPSTALTLHAASKATLIATIRSDHTLVRHFAEHALALPVGEDSPSVRWDRRCARASLLADSGDLMGAAEIHRATLSDEPPPGRPGQQEVVSVHIAYAQRRHRARDLDGVLELVDKGIEICRRHGDEWNLSFLLCLRGAGLSDAGCHEEALAIEREALRLARDGFNTWAVVRALECTAQLFAMLGQPTHTAVMLGALKNLWSRIDVLTCLARPPDATLETRTREQLGESAFTAATELGARMSLEDVVAYVLDEPKPKGTTPPKRHTQPAVLTPRELQVAELVARGLSNKEIAHALVLSPRTAEGHVARLLDKLGFDSRARVAAWVAERRAGGH